MSDWFDLLHDKRQRLVATLEENETNLKLLLEDKYADPAHFVYELLQNAEDQGAKHVEFRLDADKLFFTHYGKPFTRKDVESITNVGNSTKAGEANKIGCFGIGFKSVFDVTDRPSIYSTLEGEAFGFAIEKKFIPFRVTQPQNLLKPNETRFVFPFKAGNEEDIFSKIWGKLRTLGPETLLFLDNIESIKWRSTTEEGEYICDRADPMGGKVHLLWERSRGTEKVTDEITFLRYSKISPFTRGSSELKVSLAFRLQNNKVVPEEGLSVLHVFFPTSEKTGLKFRLHAPMLLTDSRANIRVNEPQNRQLVKTCAELLARSLIDMRNGGYINADCLNCLPTRAADFPEGSFFRPMYQAVKDALGGKEPLLPTLEGSSRSHVTARYGKISESSTLRGLINEAQLTDLHDLNASDPACWLDERIRKGATADLWVYLQKELEVEEIDIEAFASMVPNEFFGRQSDAWMIQFYTALLDARSLWEKGRPNPRLRRKAIVRLQDDTQIVPFNELGQPNAFLPTGGRSKINPVSPTIYANEKASEFLIALGLRPPDAVDEVLYTILPAYMQSPPPPFNFQEYALQLKTIASAIENCPDARVEQLRKGLIETPFLRVHNFVDSNKVAWGDPNNVYLPSKELETWFEGNEEVFFVSKAVLYSPAWPRIIKFLNSQRRNASQKEETEVLFDRLCFRTGAADADGSVTLNASHGRHRKTAGSFDPDCEIDGLTFALENMNFARAQILWNLLVNNTHLVQGRILTATLKDYSNQTSSWEMSEVGKTCREYEWLPSEDGEFCLPSTIALFELPPDFDTTLPGAILLSTQLGMKQVVKTQQEIEAEKLGVTASVWEYIKSNPEKIAEFVSSMQTSKTADHFPSDENATFSQRRDDKIQLEAQNAQEVKPEVRPRTIRHPSSIYKMEAKAYMQNKYKNDRGHMFCQICEQTMPFELNDGNPYFELVQYIKKWPKETIRHFLALCPTCAAKYLYVNSTSPDVLHHAAINADLEAGTLRIPVRLANKECTIRFTKGHLRDLKNTLIGMTAQGDVDDTE